LCLYLCTHTCIHTRTCTVISSCDNFAIWYRFPFLSCFLWSFIFFYYCSGVRLCLWGTRPVTGLLSIPQMKHEWMWNSGGMILTGRPKDSEMKPAPIPPCPSQIPHGLTRVWTLAINCLSCGTAWSYVFLQLKIHTHFMQGWENYSLLTGSMLQRYSDNINTAIH
jgi:hypothetical protein